MLINPHLVKQIGQLSSSVHLMQQMNTPKTVTYWNKRKIRPRDEEWTTTEAARKWKKCTKKPEKEMFNEWKTQEKEIPIPFCFFS
jgi:hypothetical protein